MLDLLRLTADNRFAIAHVGRYIHDPFVTVNDRKFASVCGLSVVYLDPWSTSGHHNA